MAPVLIVLSIWGYRNAERSLQELSDTQLTDRTTLIAYDINIVHHRLDLSGFLKDTRLLNSNLLIYVADARGRILYGPRAHGVAWILPSRHDFLRSLQIGDTTAPASVDVRGTGYHVVTVPIYDGDKVAGAVQAGVPTHELDDKITRLLSVQIAGTLIALFVTAAGGVFLAYRASKPVEAAATQQQQFTNDAAHDLRTPIAIIRGQADVALEHTSASPDDLRDALQRIRTESEHLANLVDALLTLARAEAQALEMNYSIFPLDELALTVSRRASPVAAARGIALHTVGTTTVEVRGDFDRLESALLNCVDNAVKYSKRGGEVNIEVGDENGFGWIQITDTGVGIASEQLALVGTRFYRPREHTELDGARRGSGLGLAIAGRIAELHSGKIEVSSVEGEGTRVRLYLPRILHPK
ncbi:MAG: ATP-binding protein [Chloroflexota bacterium]